MTLALHDLRNAPSETYLKGTVLSLLLVVQPWDAAAQEGKVREIGEPFRSVFPFTGLTSNWWRAEYDHSAAWLETGWRKQAVAVDEAGVTFNLAPSSPEQRVSLEEMNTNGGALIQDGMTSKKFISGQLQHNKWFGYGRFEIVMQAAAGEGLISALYLYTGEHFGDSHEEIDIEILGKDSTKAQFNSFRDGVSLPKPPWMDLGFESAEAPRLYAFEWSETSIAWYVEDKLMFRLEGAEQMPRPPMKIYVELWASGDKHTNWAGVTPEDTHAKMLVQCVSYSPLAGGTPTCGDLMTDE
ncbi:family 16 glycosylhydrolase [Alloyangia pacifica]|uniref:family 16 glycosylhydrolase n=1 Tax=Alloyangia pacifica TaxID=311180 RepID=UPI001CD6C89B|nr:family 16 glycosylhydrolase [Alloyangia pacifica]MCA0997319.1 family 16 glycosylhydrolase [Alloyangia pacifica]